MNKMKYFCQDQHRRIRRLIFNTTASSIRQHRFHRNHFRCRSLPAIVQTVYIRPHFLHARHNDRSQSRSAFVQALEKYNQTRTCSLQMGQSMNIGMYAVHDILRFKSTLRMLRGRNNSTKEEGILFDKSDAWASYSKCGCELSRGPDSKRVIDTGISRGQFQHLKKHVRGVGAGVRSIAGASQRLRSTRSTGILVDSPNDAAREEGGLVRSERRERREERCGR